MVGQRVWTYAYAQDNGTGRDHNPGGFTVWLAGGGFQAGLAYGRTDELGFEAIEGKCTCTICMRLCYIN